MEATLEFLARDDMSARLQLRHVEPLRWAAANRTEWVGAERGELMSLLEQRLVGRTIHRKTEGVEGAGSGRGISRETPHEWAASLAWGDLLAILVIDEALRQPGITGELFKQAAADLKLMKKSNFKHRATTPNSLLCYFY